MPNHCENDLYVSGPEEEVKRFLTFIGANKDTPEFDFDKIIPYPDNFKQRDEEAKAFSFFGGLEDSAERDAAREAFVKKWGNDRDGFNSGGYEWCCENWGTKWDAYEVSVFDHPTRGACIAFMTAWSPPEPIFDKLTELFPNLRFELEYFECGAGFCGGWYYRPEVKQYDEDPVSKWHSNEYTGPRGG